MAKFLVILSTIDRFNLSFALARQKASELFGENYVVYHSRFPSIYIPPAPYDPELESANYIDYTLRLVKFVNWLETQKNLGWYLPS